MKTRRHHNNKGLRQIRRGRTAEQIKRMARPLGVPYGRMLSAEEQRIMHEALRKSVTVVGKGKPV